MKRQLEGYWNNKDNDYPEYPMPESCKLKVWSELKGSFLCALEQVENVAKIHRFKGWSNCRICNENVGNITYELKNFAWPEGLEHYIRKHNVMPSKKFIVFISKEFARL